MHIEDEKLKQFSQGTLETDEIIKLLEHMKDCSYCTEQFMQIEENNQMKAPVYLKDNILNRTKMPDIKVKTQLKVVSKKTELFFYSLKTTAAVVCALLLLFSVSYVNQSNVLEQQQRVSVSSDIGSKLYEKSNDIVHIMNYFSNRIMNGGRN